MGLLIRPDLQASRLGAKNPRGWYRKGEHSRQIYGAMVKLGALVTTFYDCLKSVYGTSLSHHELSR